MFISVAEHDLFAFFVPEENTGDLCGADLFVAAAVEGRLLDFSAELAHGCGVWAGVRDEISLTVSLTALSRL